MGLAGALVLGEEEEGEHDDTFRSYTKAALCEATYDYDIDAYMIPKSRLSS